MSRRATWIHSAPRKSWACSVASTVSAGRPSSSSRTTRTLVPPATGSSGCVTGGSSPTSAWRMCRLPHDGRNNARSRTSTRRTDYPCRVAGRRHKSLCLGPASYEFSTARALDQRLVPRPQDIDLGLEFGALGTGWVDVRETTLDGSPLGEHVADTVHPGRELRCRPLDRIEERSEPAVGLFEDRGTDPHELTVESPEYPLGKDPLRPRREVRGAPRFLFRRVGWDCREGVTRQ